MSALGFVKEGDEGRYSNETYTVWDVVPRNALVDYDGGEHPIQKLFHNSGINYCLLYQKVFFV